MQTQTDRQKSKGQNNYPDGETYENRRLLKLNKTILSAVCHQIPIDQGDGNKQQISAHNHQQTLEHQTQNLLGNETNHRHVHADGNYRQHQQIADAPVEEVQIDVRPHLVVLQDDVDDQTIGHGGQDAQHDEGNRVHVDVVKVDLFVRVEGGVRRQICDVHRFCKNTAFRSFANKENGDGLGANCEASLVNID